MVQNLLKLRVMLRNVLVLLILKPSNLLEKKQKKIDWKDKLYLSPLTTVGNLPFRRICKEFGVDITCGEMAMASNILQGANQEWALIKRHATEDIFGVQVCGNNPYVLTRCAQVLQEQANIDFVDINMGCPIDLVYQQGGGCGLMRREKVLYSVVECMNDVLDIPLTIKMRTGVYSDKNTAHKLISGLCDRGVSLITVHGRSREQRYTRSADWNYIETCAALAGQTPLFGNGDILSYQDYVEARVSIQFDLVLHFIATYLIEKLVAEVKNVNNPCDRCQQGSSLAVLLAALLVLREWRRAELRLVTIRQSQT
ncbi:tRNA-dihydrouridine(47) synthase [NAD(P)(+)]-like [Nilaparvata lugens]|uniref:tRNA-dihydrouridine(47) synthase [NAD(P)(+)]-like n=1 Tax=Nilaparvata lugens TaxID=108931 RepID=UPI00193DBCF5|nr:tRNA-dihydrouridine(47) synthase [NAD(P)(+)]-like [Nilaparvata lugens]